MLNLFLKEYQNFRIGSDGNLQGVGLFVNAEPTSGHLVSTRNRVTLFLSISVWVWFLENIDIIIKLQ